eukprot:GFKZ01000622.1.p1 GENE.GFKZ01000622.1~~GFKZ01000622.1.p1  ORF type:complete len:134 (+),score=3.90 GFKZ01000622.1:72-473(+)
MVSSISHDLYSTQRVSSIWHSCVAEDGPSSGGLVIITTPFALHEFSFSEPLTAPHLKTCYDVFFRSEKHHFVQLAANLQYRSLPMEKSRMSCIIQPRASGTSFLYATTNNLIRSAPETSCTLRLSSPTIGVQR